MPSSFEQKGSDVVSISGGVLPLGRSAAGAPCPARQSPPCIGRWRKECGSAARLKCAPMIAAARSGDVCDFACVGGGWCVRMHRPAWAPAELHSSEAATPTSKDP